MLFIALYIKYVVGVCRGCSNINSVIVVAFITGIGFITTLLLIWYLIGV